MYSITMTEHLPICKITKQGKAKKIQAICLLEINCIYTNLQTVYICVDHSNHNILSRV